MATEPANVLPSPDRRLPIGAFARLTGLTHKALKTYERYGLLTPAHVNAETHYRSYSLRQVRTAAIIRLLRSVDMPLRDVAGALQAGGEPSAMSALLIRHRDRLAGQLAATDRLLARLQLLGGDDSPDLLAGMAVCPVPAHVALVCEADCRFETHEVTVDRLLEHLAKLLGALHLEPLTRETATYYAGFEFPPDYRVEVSVPVAVPHDCGATLPPRCRRVPETRVATALHRGPYGETWTTTACLISWALEHDLPLDGRFSETYLVDERDTDDPEGYCTLVSLPIVDDVAAGASQPSRRTA